MCDESGEASRIKHITRKKYAGIHLRNKRNGTGIEATSRKYAKGGWAIISAQTQPLPKPPEDLVRRIEACSEADVINDEHAAQLDKFLKDAHQDITEEENNAHRPRKRLGVRRHELRTTAREMTKVTKRALKAGWTLIRRGKGWTVLDQSDTTDVSWGFN